MRTRIPVAMTLCLLLCACSNIDGVYSPDCAAYSGSQIVLKDGQFTWTKFTDEVVVDEAGDKVDQFPGFPLRGEYDKSGEKISLERGEGEESTEMHLSEINEDLFLYTAGEFDLFVETGKRPDCALKLQRSAVEN